jgi:hypothetical protein
LYDLQKNGATICPHSIYQLVFIIETWYLLEIGTENENLYILTLSFKGLKTVKLWKHV